LFLAALIATDAGAQAWPTRAIRILTVEAGGSSDLPSRLIAKEMHAHLGQPAVVENRGIIGVELVAQAAPDGHTLVHYTSPLWIVPLFRSNAAWDAARDFTPIALTVASPNVLVVHPSLPVKSVKEFIALAKARPGELNYASSGNGSGGHLAAELFRSMAGVKMTHVPYKGSGLGQIDLIAGQVSLMFTSPVPALPHVKAGKLRALATTGARRSSAMPDLPTIAESGLPGYESTLWYGILAPAGTPEPITALLQKQIVAALALPEMKERFGPLGIDIVGSTSQAFLEYIKTETAKWSKVIKAAGIRPD
jgi:tripartite-type tricarboxylate transporter receptor subunit TctC